MNRFEANLALSILFLLLGKATGMDRVVVPVLSIIGIGYAVRAAIALWRNE